MEMLDGNFYSILYGEDKIYLYLSEALCSFGAYLCRSINRYLLCECYCSSSIGSSIVLVASSIGRVFKQILILLMY